MSDASFDRRTALVALGVAAVGTGALVGATTAPTVASTSETDVSSRGGALVGLVARDYRVTEQTELSHGAIAVALQNADGDRFRVTLCARDHGEGALRGPARTERFELFLDNEGDGATPTHEARGLATMALADALRGIEASLALDGLLPLRERLARHAGELVSTLA